MGRDLGLAKSVVQAQESFRLMLARGDEQAVHWDRDVTQDEVGTEYPPRLYNDKIVYLGPYESSRTPTRVYRWNRVTKHWTAIYP